MPSSSTRHVIHPGWRPGLPYNGAMFGWPASRIEYQACYVRLWRSNCPTLHADTRTGLCTSRATTWQAASLRTRGGLYNHTSVRIPKLRARHGVGDTWETPTWPSYTVDPLPRGLVDTIAVNGFVSKLRGSWRYRGKMIYLLLNPAPGVLNVGRRNTIAPRSCCDQLPTRLNGYPSCRACGLDRQCRYFIAGENCPAHTGPWLAVLMFHSVRLWLQFGDLARWSAGVGESGSTLCSPISVRHWDSIIARPMDGLITLYGR